MSVAVIPARKHSRRFPGKHLAILLGKPLIAWTIEAALGSKKLNLVAVSSDDEEILKLANRYNCMAIRRPEKYKGVFLSADEAPLEAPVKHAVDVLTSAGTEVDTVVILQANLSIRKPGMIDKCIETLTKENCDSVVTLMTVPKPALWMKQLKKGKVHPFMQPPLLHRVLRRRLYRTQDVEALYWLDGAVIAVKKDVLMSSPTGRIHGYLGENVRGIVQERKYSIEVDEPIDLKIAEAILRSEL